MSAVNLCFAENFWAEGAWAAGFWAGVEADFTLASIVVEYRDSTQSAWVDVTSSTLAVDGVQIEFGARGWGPRKNLADGGSCTFTLRNAPTLGLFSPFHASVSSAWGVDVGLRVRFLSTSGKSYTRFFGRVTSIIPEPGEYGTRRVTVIAEDYIGLMADWAVTGATVQANASESALVSAILDLLPLVDLDSALSPEVDLDEGVDVYPIALDQAQDGDSGISVLMPVLDSSFAFFFQRGDGTLRLINRNNRTYRPVVATFTAAELRDLVTPHNRADVYDRVDVEIPDLAVGASAEVVASLEGEDTSPIPAGETVYETLRFRDPNDTASQPVSIGVTGGISPVATTDYLYNTAADGSGSNLTGSMTVVAAFQAGQVVLSITNGSASPAYRTFLQVRGTAIRRYAPRVVSAGDGLKRLTVSAPLQPSATTAQFMADVLLGQFETSAQRPREIEILPHLDWRQMRHAMTREPGDRIHIEEAVTATEADAIIQSVSLRLTAPNRVACRFGLGPQSSYLFLTPWALGELGESELGETTVLG